MFIVIGGGLTASTRQAATISLVCHSYSGALLCEGNRNLPDDDPCYTVHGICVEMVMDSVEL